MVELKRAIRRQEGLVAECEDNGMCQARFLVQGKARRVDCGYFAGTHEDARGLLVRCRYQKPEARGQKPERNHLPSLDEEGRRSSCHS
jgi:hypothetical protein